jgi:Fe2+ transport system protein FeoA
MALLFALAGNGFAQTASLDLDLAAGNQSDVAFTGDVSGATTFSVEVHASSLVNARSFEVRLTYNTTYFTYNSISLTGLTGQSNVFSSNGGTIFTGPTTFQQNGSFQTVVFTGTVPAANAVTGAGLVGVVTLNKQAAFVSPQSTALTLTKLDIVNAALQLQTATITSGTATLTVNDMPSSPAITTPAPGSSVTVGGMVGDPFTAAWAASSDTESDALSYTWELLTQDLSTTLLTVPVAAATQVTLTMGDVRALLVANGISIGQSITVAHRAVVTDGFNTVIGATSEVTLTLGNFEPSPAVITSPADGAAVTIEGQFEDAFTASWAASVDVENDPLTYEWQLYLGSTELATVDVGADTQVDLTMGQVRQILVDNGIAPGGSVTVQHRAVVSDGTNTVVGPFSEVTLTLGNFPPSASSITSPADGASVSVEGMTTDPFTVSWSASVDPEGGALDYTWELYAGDGVTLLASVPVGAATQVPLTIGQVRDILTSNGVSQGQSITVLHRAVVTDGTYIVTGDLASVTLTLNVVNDAPSAPANLQPGAGATVLIEGDPDADLFTASWDASTDPDADALTYTWDVATDGLFGNIVFTITGLSDTSLTLKTRQLNDLLRDVLNVTGGNSISLYHRVSASDGVNSPVLGDAAQVTFTRGLVTSIEDVEIPTEFSLKGNYPNPFNPSTSIGFDLPSNAIVSIEVYDLQGRQVMAMPDMEISAGANRSVQVNASNLGSGLYIYRVVAELATGMVFETGKMTLLK